MGTWSSRGLRGSTLEDMINMTNEHYRQQKLALIQKIPTPITPVEIDQSTRHITLAYFEKQSTVDYIGAVQGIPVCFDAKECAVKTFPIMNIHEHQVKFMEDFEKQGGISFILLFFSSLNETYYIPFKDIKFFYERSLNGGRKSFKYNELNQDYILKSAPGAMIHFLEGIQKDLSERDLTEN
mgnify:CR=1 FL=1